MPQKKLYWVFVATLIVARLFFLVSFLHYKEPGFQPDSYGYWRLGINLCDQGAFSQSKEPPFSPEAFRTPGYPFFLAVLRCLGMASPYWAIFWQELIYLGVVFLLFWAIRRFSKESLARALLIFALIEPGGIAFPKFILSEVFFLPFFIGSIICFGLYCHSNKAIFLSFTGGLMGIATYVRPAALYFPVVASVVLIFHRGRLRDRIYRGIGLLLPYILLVAPWYMRNYSKFHIVEFTGAKGVQMMEYHVPFVWESAKGISFNEGRRIIQERARISVSRKEAELGRPLNAMETFDLYQKIGLEELRRYPFEYFKQWIYGILKTIVGTNITEVYTMMGWHQDRIHFFDVAEPSFARKIYGYLSHQDMFLLLEVFLRFMIALGAVIGVLEVYYQRNLFLLLIVLANIYFLSIPGPVGYSRYRFPVECFWFFQSLLGYCFLKKVRDFRRSRRHPIGNMMKQRKECYSEKD